MAEPSGKGGDNLRSRKKKDVAENMVDRLSGMPDEILTSILSLLPMKEAQATSILSRRWQHLWPYCTTLNFDAGKQFLHTFREVQSSREREQGVCRYVNWVDSVLKQHKAPNIERFRVAFELGPRSFIDKWIQFAMRKGVQILELDLSAILDPTSLNYYGALQYKLCNIVLGIGEFSTCKDLCSEYIGFRFLRILDFNCVDVDQDILQYFIYNCPVLERVAVFNSRLLYNVRVVGQSIALKYLTIQQCVYLKSIEICDSNLVSFTYGGKLENLLLRNLPLLVEVSLSGWGWRNDVFTCLSCCVSQLEILKINTVISRGETYPIIPSLPNLKCLELEFCESNKYALLHLAFFLRQTPRLHTLVLKFQFRETMNSPFAKKREARYSHDCLKVVTIVGYDGVRRHIEPVEYLMKTAINIERIIFDPYRQFPKRYRAEAEVDLSRAEARKLKEQLPATLEVVCL